MECLENDGVIDDNECRELDSLAERLGIPACDIEQLISSITQTHEENT